MSFLRPSTTRLPIRAAKRTFSSTTAAPASLQIDGNDREAVADTVPEYPHGPARWYKQSNKGLYGGQRIQFGNNVSGDFNTKTRRTFQVNVLSKRLWSHALDRFIQVRVTARTLRTIDRVGGLDEYLLSDNASRIKQLGVSGWWLRWAIMQQPAVKARFERELFDLGLGSKEAYEAKLQALGKNRDSVDLDEAYDALPVANESDPYRFKELSRNLEGMGELKRSPSAEQVLSVSDPSGLPPLKFRTSRGVHVMLTSDGWARSNIDRSEATRKWIADNQFTDYVKSRMAAFEAQLKRLQKEGDMAIRNMSLSEEKEVLKDARRRFTKELEDMVDSRMEEKAMRTVERRATKVRETALKGERERMQDNVGEREAARKGAMGQRNAMDVAAERAAEQVAAAAG